MALAIQLLHLVRAAGSGLVRQRHLPAALVVGNVLVRQRQHVSSSPKAFRAGKAAAPKAAGTILANPQQQRLATLLLPAGTTVAAMAVVEVIALRRPRRDTAPLPLRAIVLHHPLLVTAHRITVRLRAMVAEAIRAAAAVIPVVVDIPAAAGITAKQQVLPSRPN